MKNKGIFILATQQTKVFCVSGEFPLPEASCQEAELANVMPAFPACLEGRPWVHPLKQSHPDCETAARDRCTEVETMKNRFQGHMMEKNAPLPGETGSACPVYQQQLYRLWCSGPEAAAMGTLPAWFCGQALAAFLALALAPQFPSVLGYFRGVGCPILFSHISSLLLTVSFCWQAREAEVQIHKCVHSLQYHANHFTKGGGRGMREYNFLIKSRIWNFYTHK